MGPLVHLGLSCRTVVVAVAEEEEEAAMGMHRRVEGTSYMTTASLTGYLYQIKQMIISLAKTGVLIIGNWTFVSCKQFSVQNLSTIKVVLFWNFRYFGAAVKLVQWKGGYKDLGLVSSPDHVVLYLCN